MKRVRDDVGYAPPRPGPPGGQVLRPPPTSFVFRVLIPKAAVADVVGTNNKQNLRRLNEESGANIQMFQAPHNAPFGVAAVAGSAPEVHSATLLLMESARIIDGLAVLIANADVPLALALVDTPAKLALASKQLSRDSPDTVIDVKGSPDAINATVMALCRELERREAEKQTTTQDRKLDLTKPPADQRLDGWQRSVVIPVHAPLIAKLQGPNNVTIDSIRRESHANISFGDATADEVPVGISGPETAVELAVRRVYELLNEPVPNVRELAETAARTKGKEFAGGYF